jgi:hypothetical protein
MIFKMLKRLPFLNQDTLALRQEKSSEIITIDYSKRFQRIEGNKGNKGNNAMSAEDRQKYLTLLRDSFIKEQRESLVFYVYYHDENYYGILSACTQLNVNFLAKSNSILIEASEFEQLMMEVEEGGVAALEESSNVWQAPEVAQPSWLDEPIGAVAAPPVVEDVVTEEVPFSPPVYDFVSREEGEQATPTEESHPIFPIVDENSVVEVAYLPEERPVEAPYVLSPEEIAEIHAATQPVASVASEAESLFVAPIEPEIEPEIEYTHKVVEQTFVAPVVIEPVYEEPAPILVPMLVPVDMEAKPLHNTETLQEIQRKTLEVRQNSIELREDALRQREKAVNDWERSLNAREAEVETLRDTFDARKQTIAQQEQRLVSMEEEVLLKRNILEESFAKLDEVKREARRVLG